MRENKIHWERKFNVMAETTPAVHSVLHAIRILELYAAQRRETLILPKISKALGLQTGKYYLGTGILLVASAVSVHNTSRDLLSEEMHRLAEKFNETVVLSVLLGHTGICADLAKSRHRLGVAGERGYIVPLRSGATGKTLLAAQPEELREQLLQELEPDRTKQRILKNQLLKILQDGYCISEGEVDQGVAAIAMPLHLKDKRFVLTISGPVDRLRAITYPVLRQGLEETVTRLERKSALLEE